MVELRGFEPLTPSLRTRCSAELSYSPGMSAIVPGLTGGAIRLQQDFTAASECLEERRSLSVCLRRMLSLWPGDGCRMGCRALPEVVAESLGYQRRREIGPAAFRQAAGYVGGAA